MSQINGNGSGSNSVGGNGGASEIHMSPELKETSLSELFELLEPLQEKIKAIKNCGGKVLFKDKIMFGAIISYKGDVLIPELTLSLTGLEVLILLEGAEKRIFERIRSGIKKAEEERLELRRIAGAGRYGAGKDGNGQVI